MHSVCLDFRPVLCTDYSWLCEMMKLHLVPCAWHPDTSVFDDSTCCLPSDYNQFRKYFQLFNRSEYPNKQRFICKLVLLQLDYNDLFRIIILSTLFSC